jgi:hypothetical protein
LRSFINFPAFFGALFALIKPFIPAKTLSKFVMLGPISPERGELMAEHGIPPHWCPQRYGGLLPDDADASNPAPVPAELIVLPQGTTEKRVVDVPAGAAAAIDVSDHAGDGRPTSMRVVLRCLDKDVRCQVTCSSLKVCANRLFDGSAMPLVLHATQRVVSFELLASPGSRLTFTFDNTYSRFTPKTVLFGCSAV